MTDPKLSLGKAPADDGLDAVILDRMTDTLTILQCKRFTKDRASMIAALKAVRDKADADVKVVIVVEGKSEELVVRQFLATLNQSSIGAVEVYVARANASAQRVADILDRAELPDGPRRKFVTELRRYWRAAGRPPLREISQAIERHPDPRLVKVTASAETVRRMITGKVLPVNRDRVYAVFRVLCDMAEVDPDAERWGERDHRDDTETNWQYLQGLWDAALEESAGPT
jgi:hypothetical protein